MFSLRHLCASRAARNAAASYLAFASTALCGLTAIPVAVHYLSKAQMGLWTIVYTVVGYLLWMDLGIGNATGRKIAEAMTKQDATEINRWWTLSVGVLCILGLMMLIVALGLSAFIGPLLNIPAEQTGDALWLFLGTAAVSALGMPVRAYPGLLLAQERFHWVPLVQAMMPWLQLAAFWSLLHLGYGIRSYFPALAFSQICGWVVFVWQVHGKGLHINIDFGGWTRSRFHELFSYSSSLALGGIVNSFIQSLPALLIARLGGLALVPVYNLSRRGPNLLNALGQRTTQAFYPNLQKLYVSGETFRFQEKYRHVNQLGIWVSLVGAGAVLAGNRTLICWLAKTDFYAGHWTNVWFAIAVITIPFVGGVSNLLQYSGRMGKAALFALLELPVAIALLTISYRFWQLPGLAAAFAVLPLLVRGPYAMFAGPRHCGMQAWTLCGHATITMFVTLAMIMLAGLWIGSLPLSITTVEILGRTTLLPTLPEALVGSLLAILGMTQAIQHLRKIRSA